MCGNKELCIFYVIYLYYCDPSMELIYSLLLMADKIKRKVSSGLSKKKSGNNHDSTSSSDSSDSKQQQQQQQQQHHSKKKKDKSSGKHFFSEAKEAPLSIIHETHAHLIPQYGNYYSSDNSSSLESIGEDTKSTNSRKGTIVPYSNGLNAKFHLKDKCSDNELTMIHHINQLYKKLDELQILTINMDRNMDILLAERRLMIQRQVDMKHEEEEEEKNSYTNCLFSYIPF